MYHSGGVVRSNDSSGQHGVRAVLLISFVAKQYPICRCLNSSTPPGDGTTTVSSQTPSWGIRFRASGSPTPSLGRKGLVWRSEHRHQLAWRCQNLAPDLPAGQTFRLEAMAWFRSTSKCRRIERTGGTVFCGGHTASLRCEGHRNQPVASVAGFCVS